MFLKKKIKYLVEGKEDEKRNKKDVTVNHGKGSV